MCSYHWNENVFILMKCSSLAALEVIKMTTSSAASDENFVKMTTFSFQGYCTPVRWRQLGMWHHRNRFIYFLLWSEQCIIFAFTCAAMIEILWRLHWYDFENNSFKSYFERCSSYTQKPVQIIKQKWNLNSAASTLYTCVTDSNLNKDHLVSRRLSKI